MNRYFAINGYHKDDGENIDGYIVTDAPEPEGGCDLLDEIFAYNMSEEELLDAMQLGDKYEEDFVITHYEEITELYEVTR